MDLPPMKCTYLPNVMYIWAHLGRQVATAPPPQRRRLPRDEPAPWKQPQTKPDLGHTSASRASDTGPRADQGTFNWPIHLHFICTIPTKVGT